jgi:hypothetical protein
MTNQLKTPESELQKQIAELTSLLKPPYEAEDPVVVMGNSLAALTEAIVAQTETIDLLRAEISNLTAAILEQG